MSLEPLTPETETVLTLIAQGHTYEQILHYHPAFTYHTIFDAARDALERLHAVAGATVRLPAAVRYAAIRQTHPQAYTAWSADDDQRLTTLFQAGNTIPELMIALGRQQGGIESRLRKLGLMDDGVEHDSEPPSLLPF